MGSVFGTINEEKPKYKLIKKTDSYEIRLYDECIAIETSNSSDDNSFMKLAGYIGVLTKPQNISNESIAMTSPVVNTNNKMQFILPSKYKTINDVPKPTNKNITIIQRPKQLFAIKQFNGAWDYNETIKIKDEFILELNKNKINIISPLNWELYRYNSPFTIPYFRTNEIAIQIKN